MSIRYTTLQSAMDEDIEVLVIVEQLKEAGTDPSKQVPHLLNLGKWYEKKAKTTADGYDFTKANVLYNAALVRSRRVKHKIDEDEILRRIIDAYREFLSTFTCNDDEISRDEIQDEIHTHKKFLADERRALQDRVEDIDSRFRRSDEPEGQDEVFHMHAEKMYEVFRDIQDMYVRLVETLVKECEARLGKPPCDYAIIALGSIARMEATPFSDLEFAILYSDPAIGNKIDYFRVLSHFLHLKVINLGETIIPTLGIEHLNDFQSSDPNTNWFYDSHTPRGISFDGAMPWASKTALGRQATKEKPALELIRTPERMAELQAEDIAPKEGYHLADILTRASLLYGEQALLDEYNERVADKLNAKSSQVTQGKSSQTVGFARGVKQLILDCVTYNPYNSYLGDYCTVGALFDAKKQFYRLISLLLSGLGLMFDVRCPSPWGVISALQTRGIITVSDMANINVCLSIANEIRLKTYFANNGQRELLSPIPQYVNDSEQSTDAIHQPPIFRYCDEDILVRLLSTSNDIRQRCHEFLFRVIHEGVVDITALQKPSVLFSIATLKGTLYFRLQNFPKALEWMQSEPKESPDYSVSLDGQGIVYTRCGQYNKGIECFKNALKVHYQNETVSILNVRSCLNNLALAHMHLGQFKMARIKLEEAIAKHDEIYGKGFATVGLCRTMRNLGKANYELADFRLSIEIFQEVEKMQNSLTDATAPTDDVVQLNIDIALSLSELAEHPQSLEYVKKALHLSKKLFGDEDRSARLAQIYVLAATVYEHCNLNDEAQFWYKRGLEILQLVYGDISHPGKISCLNNLGNFYSRRYQTDMAVENLEGALKEGRTVYHGKPNITVAGTLSNLGVALKRAEKWKESLVYFQEAKEMMDQILGENHVHHFTSDILNNMGTIYQDLGDLNTAYRCYKDVLKMNTALYGEDGTHDALATVCSNIACVAEELGELLEAKEYYAKAVDIDRRNSSTRNTSPGLVSSLYGLSSVCDALDEQEEAIKHLEEAREVGKITGSKHFMAVVVLLELAEKYEEIESIAKSQECFKEAREIGESLAKDDSLSPSLLAALKEKLG